MNDFALDVFNKKDLTTIVAALHELSRGGARTIDEAIEVITSVIDQRDTSFQPSPGDDIAATGKGTPTCNRCGREKMRLNCGKYICPVC